MANGVDDDVWADDIFFVDPFEIAIGDRSDDPANELIIDMAISLHKHGQRRPVECHSEDKRLVLDHGRIRVAAARLFCAGFTYLDSETGNTVAVKDKRFKLKVVMSIIGSSKKSH